MLMLAKGRGRKAISQKHKLLIHDLYVGIEPSRFFCLLLMETSKRISINSAGKRALADLLSLKVIHVHSKRPKILQALGFQIPWKTIFRFFAQTPWETMGNNNKIQ